MAETAAPTGNAAPQPVLPRMQVLGQFIRDLSFENVVSQKAITGEVSPDIQVQVSLDARKRTQDRQYEVILTLKITSKNRGTDAVLFAMELEYGGIFHIENVPDDQMHPYLMIQCPTMLFPFVRRIVSDVTRDGGFPALNLDTIDFIGLYRQELARRMESQKAAGEQKLQS